MDFKLHWHSVNENLKRGIQPLVMIERPCVGGNARDPHGDLFSVAKVGRTGEFWVPVSHLLMPDVQWSLTVQGEYVKVPLFAYRTPQKARGAIFAVGVELGMRAMLSLCKKSPKPPIEVTLIMGSEVHTIATDAGEVYRAYLGIAIRV